MLSCDVMMPTARAGQAKPSKATEYSIYHPGSHRWIIVGPDGGARFQSDQPVSLKRFFPKSPEAGSEDFARRMLGWIRAGHSERQHRKWVDVSCDDAMAAMIFSFSVPHVAPLPDLQPMRRTA